MTSGLAAQTLAVTIMAELAARSRTMPARPSPLDAIPGCDEQRELLRMLRDPCLFFQRRFNRHGYIFKSRLVYPVVFLIGAEANKTIMVTRRHDFSYRLGYGQLALSRVFEESIMIMDGEEHQRTRDMLSPAVGRLAICDSAARVNDIWTRAVADAADGNAHDCYLVSERTTFVAAAHALTGLELGRETETFRPYFERLIKGTMAATKHRFPFGKLDRSLRAREQLMRMMRPRIIAARKRSPAGLVGQLAHYRDERGRMLPTDTVSAHLLMLMWAAYDTTASAGSWVLHVLARRPDWQRRLRDESESVLGDEPISAENAGKLPQLTWFLRELERMYPSVLFFPRVALKDIAFDGYVVPKGTATYYSPYLTHRDPAEFDNPAAFDPDRWDPDRPGRRARASVLVGFGGGPRVCLGKAFAQLQLRMMVNAIVRGYRAEPDATCRPKIQGLPIHHPNQSRVRLFPR